MGEVVLSKDFYAVVFAPASDENGLK